MSRASADGAQPGGDSPHLTESLAFVLIVLPSATSTVQNP